MAVCSMFHLIPDSTDYAEEISIDCEMSLSDKLRYTHLLCSSLKLEKMNPNLWPHIQILKMDSPRGSIKSSEDRRKESGPAFRDGFTDVSISILYSGLFTTLFGLDLYT